MLSELVVPPRMSETEWRTRVELAALYRLVALQGWDDFIFTHISARVPHEVGEFLINPFGSLFNEITASALVKVDEHGTVLGSPETRINRAGYVVHSAIHAARPDANFVIHLHSLDGIAVASQKDGLLPLNQRSLSVLPHLRYHDYEGIAVNLDERKRLAADLGDGSMMLLRNHGTLAIGASAGSAWQNIYQLETACTIQVRALSTGRERLLLLPAELQGKVHTQTFALPQVQGAADGLADMVWAAALRLVHEVAPGFDS